ncbi:hypothetical protein [Stutzerimonas stutzeri]|uniref:hypothetical protein n=1 Tax=Stutzerimonas stutzeri TaxID=316 RepID=UPI001E294357|nr:hypothetical protein [Stutzerimonas stutzeri]
MRRTCSIPLVPILAVRQGGRNKSRVTEPLQEVIDLSGLSELVGEKNSVKSRREAVAAGIFAAGRASHTQDAIVVRRKNRIKKKQRNSECRGALQANLHLKYISFLLGHKYEKKAPLGRLF